jgi:hypothetical protein
MVVRNNKQHILAQSHLDQANGATFFSALLTEIAA